MEESNLDEHMLLAVRCFVFARQRTLEPKLPEIGEKAEPLVYAKRTSVVGLYSASRLR